jgi:putative membrane protein
MLWSLVVLTVAMALCASLLPGFEVKGGFGVVKVAIVFGLVNWALGKLVFFAISVGTLGLGFLLAFVTRVVVTALLLKLTDALMDSLRIDRFRTAVWAALIVSGTGTLLEWLLEVLG